jgi:hypothetical protein
MRVGRQVELLIAAYKTYRSKEKDDVIRLTTMVKQVCFSFWLCFDTLSWVQAIGLIEVDTETKKTTTERGNKLWLAGLVASILGSFHKLSLTQGTSPVNLIAVRITMEEKAIAQAVKKGDVDEDAEKAVKSLVKEQKAIGVTLAHDAADILVPLLLLEMLPEIFPKSLVC